MASTSSENLHDRSTEGFSKAALDQSAAAKYRLEHHYSLSLEQAIERNERYAYGVSVVQKKKGRKMRFFFSKDSRCAMTLPMPISPKQKEAQQKTGYPRKKDAAKPIC